ncbi:MAG: hypothetical protein AUK47_26335 [Deltaproteobacteria bacterium CG2_30_63_29]|nr:MAG: hypothetical protein AUK47_26335 [Deltaproteobacteria bacterium CG2_30_63_29]PIV99218.1 MAG: hypothetical protein COW42_11750 [Deltaproteobacteria bacterium CG17_big_fil_post_rev_8_21_14_2_50_63_7]PJB34689.1 MAG: hypothetical protein CO108_27685 [Deltaproteobacteria bacterium CG_4_9_14_3_um_filter_63_12]
MRTKLTIDDDIAAKLRELSHERRTINEVLRRGLVTQSLSEKGEPFKVVAFTSPFRAGIDPFALNTLSDELETEEFV